jgi:environmental stress-induced protein Ves
VSGPVSEVERFDFAAIVARPWKNGAGQTREIALAPGGASMDAFDWRISVAEVERDAPFSAFAGIDRCVALLRGAGMRLRSPHGELDHRLDRLHEPFRFAGETPLDATLLGGACTDFNVMTRRGRWSAEVVPLRSGTTVAGGDATFVACCIGSWTVHGATPTVLAPMQGLLWRERLPVLTLGPQPEDPTPCLLLVRLCHDPGP